MSTLGLFMNTKNVVLCKKYGREMPALSEAPLKGPIGELIKNNVSETAWLDWVETQMKIVNEERLDLSDITAQKRLFTQMIEYLGLSDLVNREV